MPNSDAALSRLPARLRDVDERNALIVRRRAADLIERYEEALRGIAEDTQRSTASGLQGWAREALRDR